MSDAAAGHLEQRLAPRRRISAAELALELVAPAGELADPPHLLARDLRDLHGLLAAGQGGGQAGVEPASGGRGSPAGSSSSGSSSCRCQRSRCWIARPFGDADPRGDRPANESHERRPPAPPPAARGSRNAARATASASIASDLPRVATERRAPAISFGGTRTTRSPTREQEALERDATRVDSPRAPRAAPRQASTPTKATAHDRQRRAVTVRSPRALTPVAAWTAAGGVTSAYAGPLRLRSLLVPFPEVATDSGAPADRPQWGRLATLLSGHAGAPRTAAGDTSHCWSSPQGRQRP